jgi:hypothetical protein
MNGKLLKILISGAAGPYQGLSNQITFRRLSTGVIVPLMFNQFYSLPAARILSMEIEEKMLYNFYIMAKAA